MQNYFIEKQAVSTKNLTKIRKIVMDSAAKHSQGLQIPENINSFISKFHEKSYEGHQKNPLYDLFHKATGQEIMGNQRGLPSHIIEPEIHAFEKLQNMLSPYGKDSELKRINTGDVSDKIEMSGRHKGFQDKILLKRNVDRNANSSGPGIHPLYAHKGYTLGEGGASRRRVPNKDDYNYVTGAPEVTLHYMKNLPEAPDMNYSDPSTLGHYINTYNLTDFKNKAKRKIISHYSQALGKPTHLMRNKEEILNHEVLGPDLKTEPINHISNYEKTVNTNELDKRLHSKIKRLSSGQGWQQVAGKSRTPVDIDFGFNYHPNPTGTFSYNISKDKSQVSNSPLNKVNQQYLNIL